MSAANSDLVIIDTAEHFAEVLRSNTLVIAHFHSGPDRDDAGLSTISDIFSQLSTQLSVPSQLAFAKVDIVGRTRIVETYGINVTPTFITFKQGREMKRVRGADPTVLQNYVQDVAREATKVQDTAASSSSKGKFWSGAALPRGYEDVTDQVDLQGLDFLNIDSETGGARSILQQEKPSALDKRGQKDYIESDTDEQLMLFIPFQSTMKLHSIHITSLPPTDDDEAAMRPKSLRLYTNRSTVLGFDEADDTVSTQAIEIKESDYDKKTGTAKVELRYVKFQNISSVVIFVVDGLGDSEKTRIDRIRLIGESGEKKAMGKLEKIGNEQGE